MPSIRISENLHVVGGTFLTHFNDCAVYLVQGDRPVLIDCGCGEGHHRLRRNIKDLGVNIDDVEWVLGTHCHYDHVSGIGRLRSNRPGLKLALHETEAAAIEAADPDLTCAGWFFGVDIAPQRVDAHLHDGETFITGGVAFEVIHTPGHTPGSVCLRAEIDGRAVLFTGDCLVPGCDLVGSDFDDWRATLDRVNNADYELLLPGHLTQFLGDPFSLALGVKGLSAPVGESAFRLLKDNFSQNLWNSATYQYANTMPRLAKFVSNVTRVLGL